jgi:hypothetical protein
VACVSAPSLYFALRRRHPATSAWLFEYDKRFASVGGNFVFYDYKLVTAAVHYTNALRGIFLFLF